MNFEAAGKKYLELRKQKEALEREHKAELADIKEKMVMLENWFAAKAQEEGLTTVPTPAGTVYWATHHTATVASREALFDFCKETGAWDLIESRVSKKAVASHIDAYGAPPPGVNYASVSVFNFRAANSKDTQAFGGDDA